MHKWIGAMLALSVVVAGCSAAESPEQPGAVQWGLGGSATFCAPPVGNGGGGSPPLVGTFQNGLPMLNGERYSGQVDAMLEQATPTTNYGSLDHVQLNGGSNQRHGLVKWDLSSLPPTTQIQGACVRLVITDPSVSSYPAYEVYVDWTESQATWNQATTTTAWQVPGAWGASDIGSTVVVRTQGNGTGTVSVPLSVPLVRKWIQFGAQNHGVLFGNNSSNDGLRFASGNAANPASGPLLLLW